MVVMASALSSLSSSSARLGIDVMRAALPVGIPSIPEFHATIEDMVSTANSTCILYLLSKFVIDVFQLTPKEKQAVDNAHLMDKLDLLLRFWISKEAMSKAIGEGLAFNYAELDSTIVRSGGNCTIRGAPCSARELSIHAGGAEYMVCVAVLGGRDVGDVPAEVEMISVERLVADILALSEKN
jgi:phosphopantetheinyl transferase (holo-ACP synthase)